MKQNMIESKSVIKSNRLYLDELKQINIDIQPLIDTFVPYNTAKFRAYNLFYDALFLNKEKFTRDLENKIKLCLKNEFHFDDYYLSNIITDAKGVIKSQIELQSLYQDQLNDELKVIRAKISSTKKLITKFSTNQKQLIKYNKSIKEDKPLKKWKFKNYPLAHHGMKNPDELDKSKMHFFTYKDEDVDFYTYSCFIDKELKKLRNKLGKLNFAKNRLIEKQKTLTVPKRVCFGSRKLFKSKDTTDIAYKEWKEQLYLHKYSNMLFVGRYDATYGNHAVFYKNNTLILELLKKYTLNTNQKNITKSMKTYLEIPNVVFPHNQKKLDDYLQKQTTITSNTKAKKNQRTYLPLAYQISLHQDGNKRKYIIITAILSLEKKTHINYDVSTGCIAIDVNVDHLALSDLDANGNFLGGKVLPFNIYHKNNGTVKHEISRVTTEVINYCKEKKKCLVMEKLDFKKKKQNLKYQNKKLCFLLNGFAYKKIYEYLNSKAYRNDIYLYQVNPAYTSLIGKVKYMRPLGISIHLSAAYVIGRRGLGLTDKIPKYLRDLLTEDERKKHQWSQYAIIAKKTANLKKHDFYKKLTYHDILLTT